MFALHTGAVRCNITMSRYIIFMLYFLLQALFTYASRSNCYSYKGSEAVADPGFPVGGGADPLGGR